ncbi:hypothetical protein [Aquabacterium humicola]|uniref:hypothetical protein n=1 Tax=Aquabacterium humicola TaxID=3237377 RepID=UPI0025437613|nr:hypothetical protein [Rubrivivax pictus]
MRVQPKSIPQNLFRLLGADTGRTGAADGKPQAPKTSGQTAADTFETPAPSAQASERSAAPSAIHSTSRTTAAALPSKAALQASTSGWTFGTDVSALAVVSEVEIPAAVAISRPPLTDEQIAADAARMALQGQLQAKYGFIPISPEEAKSSVDIKFSDKDHLLARFLPTMELVKAGKIAAEDAHYFLPESILHEMQQNPDAALASARDAYARLHPADGPRVWTYNQLLDPQS